ncbi:MAG: UTP--glucose-1-phosphate uridylyltransferase [SAR324 cluster bacterium]|nr:UTP--glucose-1-phosphate uridylyltransferase [SAR324 cluster bacterium]MCH8887910.1 UTP--glucose-1-phosphate uridylyltransferase [SAR324 cluster bacterium]
MKGVILAAGYGTRFLPATKTVPKEMFPLIDTPAIDLIVGEMAAAGIGDILIITSRRKKALEDYFDREVELESVFRDEGATEKLRAIEPPAVNVSFVRQQRMGGTGDALLLVETFSGGDPFVVAYPDDVMLDGPSLSGQLIETHRKTGLTVLAGQELTDGDVSRYGVMDTEMRQGVEMVRAMVEKPAPGTEPSRLVAYGRYLYTAEIFAALKTSREQAGPGEFTQTAAINRLAGQGRVAVRRFEGKVLDVGTPLGYLEAMVSYGLHRPEFREDLLAYLRQVVAREG